LALLAAGVGPGDEVITTPFTFIATAEAICYLGARPVFVDIDPQTFNMDMEAVEEAVTHATRAVIPVHLFGQPVDMKILMATANRFGLTVIEDCAQSFGAAIGDQMTGTFGLAGCFSFFPSKNLGAFGDGRFRAGNAA
jgi:dTDP-4-amino-4,6-dideoxygalactose transaminase